MDRRSGCVLRREELSKQYYLERTYWWFVGRRRLVASLLGCVVRRNSPSSRVLDVGCGTGANFEVLGPFGIVLGVDRSWTALQFAAARRDSVLSQADALHLPFRTNTFDVVTGLDLLEHLPDDSAALQEMRRVLKPGGALLLTVPAYRSLWSEHDEALSHLRRYVASEVRRKVTAAGFEPTKLSYAITAVLAPTFLFRWVQTRLHGRRKPQTALIELPPVLNQALIHYLSLEAAALPLINLPFGVSVVCVCKKPG